MICAEQGCSRETSRISRSTQSPICRAHAEAKRRQGMWCSVEGCTAPYLGAGFCSLHYSRSRKGLPLVVEQRMFRPDGRPCAIDWCDVTATTKGYCKRHYYQDKHRRPFTPPEDREYRDCGIEVCPRASNRGALLCAKHKSQAYSRGMSPEQLMTALNGATCAACGGTELLGIDHDHSCCPYNQRKSCGKCNRGVLCHGCNIALGMVRDSPERLRLLANFVEANPRI